MPDTAKPEEPRLRDEIARLQQENERLRTGLRQVRELLDAPLPPSAGARRLHLLPLVGLL
jgi:hypothetical protein